MVVTVLGMLAAVLLPALTRAKARAQGVYCVNNLRQITLAWGLYAADNGGALAPNEESQAAADGPRPGWVKGNLDYAGSPDDTNLDFLLNPQDALLGGYLAAALVFKCPADDSLSFGQAGLPRVRSFSMNEAIGPNGSGSAAGQGGWLPPATYRTYQKEGDLTAPGPADLWLLIEENPDSLNDGGFALVMPPSVLQTLWYDTPSSRHENTCPISFADGHAELHAWLEPQRIPRVTYQTLAKPVHELGDPDILWLARHTAARLDGRPLPY